MKKSYIIPIVLGAMTLGSCVKDYECDIVVDKPESVATAERLSQLDVLKSYVNRSNNANFTLGLAVNSADYAAQALTYSIAKSNFDAVIDAAASQYAGNVADDGTYSFTTLSNLFLEEAPSVISGQLLAYNALNKAQLEQVISANFVKGDLEMGKFTITDFESDALGATFEMSNGSVATVVEDPKGQSGNVLQVGAPDNKAKNSYAVVNVTLPDNHKLADLRTIVFDLMLIDDASTKKNLVMIINGVRKTFSGDKPSDHGCPVDDWGRKLIELKVSDLELSEAELEKTAISIAVGPNVTSSYYYIDNITATWETGTPDKYVEKTDAEKSQALADNFEAYFNALMAVSAPNVSDYVVVANPMSDDDAYTLRTAENEAELGNDTSASFFLNDYMGDNYVATLTNSMKKAYAANGGTGALKLYVKESNLLGNPGKVQRLLKQIADWTAAGAQIDGIAIDLPLAYSDNAAEQAANEAAVKALFESINNSGKLIRLDNVSMTNANAGYYKYVINQYFMNTPNTKCAGIIFAGTGDLWKDATRTLIYEAVAEALAASR